MGVSGGGQTTLTFYLNKSDVEGIKLLFNLMNFYFKTSGASY